MLLGSPPLHLDADGEARSGPEPTGSPQHNVPTTVAPVRVWRGIVAALEFQAGSQTADETKRPRPDYAGRGRLAVGTWGGLWRETQPLGSRRTTPACQQSVCQARSPPATWRHRD